MAPPSWLHAGRPGRPPTRPRRESGRHSWPPRRASPGLRFRTVNHATSHAGSCRHLPHGLWTSGAKIAPKCRRRGPTTSPRPNLSRQDRSSNRGGTTSWRMNATRSAFSGAVSFRARTRLGSRGGRRARDGGACVRSLVGGGPATASRRLRRPWRTLGLGAPLDVTAVSALVRLNVGELSRLRPLCIELGAGPASECRPLLSHGRPTACPCGPSSRGRLQSPSSLPSLLRAAGGRRACRASRSRAPGSSRSCDRGARPLPPPPPYALL